MRAAVLTVFTAAVLLQCALAAPGVSAWGKVPKKAERRMQDACWNAIVSIDLCIDTYKSGSGDGGVIMANCCSKVNDLAACGDDVWAVAAQVLGYAAPNEPTLDAIGSAMTLLNWCPRAGTSAEDCTAKTAAVTTCLESSGSNSSPPDCCPDFQNQILACLGQPTGSAVDRDVFWYNLKATLSDYPQCRPFPETDCSAAVSMLNTCYAAVQNPANEMSAHDCCSSHNFFKLFCVNQPSEVYNWGLPNDQAFMNTLETQCQDDGGSNHNSNSGSYNGGYCDWNKVVGNGIFQWYQPQYGSGFVVTSNNMYSTGGVVFYDYGNQPWYSVNYAQYPGFYKLQPFNLYCYGGYYP